ncbi:thiamine phosphate synthase [Primorskyibacter sp. S187A]|uniref:thiamine phosphate synthase n=1 Tax=Primorskyibacter sp. S187A TaxID=3415130 RepID=UPI003C7B6237
MSTSQSAAEHPQIYLITPSSFELSSFPRDLASALDCVPIACLRLAMASHDEDKIIRAADALREVTEPRDVALVIDTHIQLAERLGLDGVHLSHGGAKAIRDARKRLGPDAIVGGHAGTSRHDGMNIGEAGADYVCFGPVGVSPLGDGAQADVELFEWWSQMIELPVVAEGKLDAESIAALRTKTDFFGLGAEIWDHESPLEHLQTLAALIASD